MHHIRVQLKSFPGQESKESDKGTQADEAGGIITRCSCWNLLFCGGLAWSFWVGIADLHCGNHQLTAVVDTSPVSALHSDHSPFLAGLIVPTSFFNEWP